MSRAPDLEAPLLAAYTEELSCYERALQSAKTLSTSLKAESPVLAQLPEFMAALDEVARIEARLDEAKLRWQAQAVKPSPPLQALLTRVAESIAQLQAHVRTAEDLAVEQRAELAQRLDAASRGRQMQRAYTSWK